MAQLLKYGSQGNDVKDLQNRLNANGYNLSVDGSFGKNTLSAVKDYQQKNGLSVDGMVGENTWGKLLSSDKPSETKGYTPTAAPETDTTKWDDTEKGSSAKSAYANAMAALQGHGDFVFSEKDWLEKIKGDIDSYGEFSYDVNSDALYQQYADQYVRQGKLASADVMGQAAAMTGGYGNSYAATVGNQAFQSYLQQLNDRVPELFKAALDRHNMGKQDLYNEYAMLLSEYEREYGEHSAEYQKLVDALGIASDDYYKGAELHLTEQDINNTNAWKRAEWEEALKQYVGGLGSTTGSNSGVTDAIRQRASEFTSNTALADYIDGLISSETITEADGDALYAEYMDENEKYVDTKDGGKKISYKDMIGSTNGWSVDYDGGWNLWSVDNDAIVIAPNGEKIRLDQLKNKLKSEGMTDSQAENAVKKLQQNLGISSNWMFGW